MNKQYGNRKYSHLLFVNGLRKDGKYSVTYSFSNGKQIKKNLTYEALQAEIAKLECMCHPATDGIT